MIYYISGKQASPLTRFLTGLVAVITLAATAFLFFWVFLAILAIGSVLALVGYARLWWIKRQIRHGKQPKGATGFWYQAAQQAAQAQAQAQRRQQHGRDGTIEGEYRVVDRDE